MAVTRRYWTTVGLAALLALWAAFLGSPLPLAGAALVLGWLLARQYRFVRAASATADGLAVDQRVERRRVTATDTTMGTVTVTAADGADCSVTLATDTPTAAGGTAVECALAPGEGRTEATFRLTWPVAGEFTVPRPTVTLSDAAGLFTQSIERGPAPSVTVEPRVPGTLHIGAGGKRITARFGEYDAGQAETGLTPAEIRKYVPGDSTRRIDWNATARLNEPHVREFDAETDRETLLFVDHRGAMGVGEAGERKLDFARQVALAVLENAQDAGDPLGWYGVGDDGTTDAVRSSTDPAHYRTVARRLRGLEPTGDAPEQSSTARLGPATARHLADGLDDETAFDRRLRPFVGATEAYVRRVASDPLFGTVRLGLTRGSEAVQTVVVTDDTNRTELREAVKLASQGDGGVVVFIAPTVLYESHGPGEADEAYRQYLDFESFRRDLASIPRVTALEVGPSDSLATVLSADQRRRRAGR